MKKSLVLLCLAALAGNAQPYGEKLYPHAGIFCSSGEVTTLTPGFLISAIVPVVPAGAANYYLDHTGPGGLYVPVATAFSKAYFPKGDKLCSATPPPTINMVGVDAIEATSSAIGGRYAHAGVYEHGIFFSMVNVMGNIASTGFYPFPNGATNPTRPTLVRSNMANEYFMCGSYLLNSIVFTYIINVKETGNLAGAGSKTYRYPSNPSSIIPTDMIISPYAANELVVVCNVTNAYGTAGSGDRGFVMRLNTTNLMISAISEIFGQAPNTGGVDQFSAISVANSPAGGGNGFVISGNSNVSGSGTGLLWALKIDPTATIIRWSTLTTPTKDAAASDMLAIEERLGPTGAYTYFGAVKSTVGMMVMKLDALGIPFIGGPPPTLNFNEFVYFAGGAGPAVARDLTLINSGGSDVGIQVYGTAPAAGGGNDYFVEAAFNGYSEFTTCTTSGQFTGATSLPGPTSITPRDIIIQTGAPQCNNFSIPIKVQPLTVNVLCNAATLPAGGNNSRQMATTGIASQQGTDDAFKVSPNPVSNKVEVTFAASDDARVDIKLFDALGRFIQSVPVVSHNGSTHVASLDLSTLNIESGIYIINATIDGVNSQQKIVYTK